MSRNLKHYAPEFIEYQEQIIEDKNYRGLPIDRNEDGSLRWVAPKSTVTGKGRLDWADRKIKEYHIESDKPYADLMYAIHPTKEKACQTCGRVMSLKYIYLNANLIKTFQKKFDMTFDYCTSIYEAYDETVKQVPENELKLFLIKEFHLDLNIEADRSTILDECERACRIHGTSKLLGPGAMSNFPDRFDGFHSYNRCCRKKEDKGRSDENLRSYTKDRRAYEYWSDGNIHSANGYMGSKYFEGYSADHIGPISLGFVHDSVNLSRMSTSDNSSKRDRLSYDSIQRLIQIENEGYTIISWYSSEIWDFIKTHLRNNTTLIEHYRLSLKQNISNYMFVLKQIKDIGKEGESFLITQLLNPKKQYYDYNYEWDEKGHITNITPRKINDANRKEKDWCYEFIYRCHVNWYSYL